MVLAFACADCGSTSVTLDAVISKHHNDRGRVPLSSIASLLQSNNSPTIVQFKGLKESVNSVDEALDQLSIDIHEMSEALARLKERRGQLADVKDKYQIALTPIRRVQPEILMEIFWQTMDSGYNVLDVKDGPWNLGRVCSKWRMIVNYHSSKLWSKPRCHITTVGPFPKNSLSLLTTALSRSGQHDLSITFYDIGTDRVSFETISALLHLFMNHSTRWREARLCLRPTLCDALTVVRGRVPALSVLGFTCLPPAQVSVDAFEIAPRLSNVMLHGMGENARVPIPVSGLVSFQDDRVYADLATTRYFLDIIGKAPQLQTFEVGYHHIDGDVSLSHNQRIRNPSLKSFDACDSNLIRSLELPSLRSIYLMRSAMADDSDSEVLTSPDALSALHEMLSHSQCSLTLNHLIIHEAYIDANVIGIVEISPQVTSFSLHADNGRWSKASDEVCRQLLSRMAETAVDNKHSVLPHLEHYDMSIESNPHDGDITFVNGDLMKMVSSRWTKSPLKSVTITLSTTPRIQLIGPEMLSREDVRTLRAYRAAGLDIKVQADDHDSMDRLRYV
ncbi:uncharacterized protein ARMOST_04184 [Armillaria ostoyae]|uniref:F-box domain-containing protein n=1 Tax=Armillaria ostoyae TaxID=47428 RepID=A0A284QWL8_ARMOS|nr:uncharacterized protein ARMOST_04184 [Armillaria ostoyae]